MAIQYKFDPFSGAIVPIEPGPQGPQGVQGNQGPTGTVSAAGDGTAALPGIAFASDTNTGIYRPGADQVAVATNGTGRLFINASGSLTSAAASASDTFIFKTQNTDRFKVTGDGQVSWGASANSGLLTWDTGLATITAQSGNSLSIRTSNSERLRITSAGLVGVGTSSANALLTLGVGTGTQYASGRATLTNTSADTGQIGFVLGDQNSEQRGGMYVRQSFGGTFTDTVIDFKVNKGGTGQSTAMHIDSSGRVGIGTTSPAFGVGDGLEVARSGVATVRVSSNTQGVELRSDAGTGTLETRGAFPLVLGTSGTERCRLDSSGRLLVGTSTNNSTYNSRLQVKSDNTTAGGALIDHYEADTTGATLFLAKSRSATVGTMTVVQNGDTLGTIRFDGADGSQHRNGASIAAQVDGTPGAADMPGRLVFSTTADGAPSPTERMRIGSNGHTYWGASSPDASNFGTSLGRVGSLGLFENFRNVNGTDASMTAGGNAGSASIYGNGDLKNTNNSYGAYSDIKLKENIVDANSQWNDLKALQVRNYNLKEGQTHTQIGLIAQEVELISPGLVSESPDRDEEGNDLGTTTKSVNYSVLYMKAVKALQEAMERIETLEAKVAALEGV